MRIAQVAPLHEAVPPKLYGGTERVVSYLTEQLVAMGHEVTLFASADSVTNANLVGICEQALRLDAACEDRMIYHVLALEQVMRQAARFDVLHFHWDYLHYPWVRRCTTPCLTTLHGRQDLRDLVPLYREYDDIPLASISDSQRTPVPWVNWVGTVHHGLPENLYRLHPKQGGYLAFLGRLSSEKRIDRAVELARRTGIPLKIAAKMDPMDCAYHETIRHLLDDPLVDYIGEIGETEKNEFLGNALAMVFPIDWPEPFGLVMIEAMACGTPTIAWQCGSVPEVIDHGVTGFIVQDMDQAMTAVRRAELFNRRRCREQFERRFSATRMATDYLKLYRSLRHLGPSPLRTALDPVG